MNNKTLLLHTKNSAGDESYQDSMKIELRTDAGLLRANPKLSGTAEFRIYRIIQSKIVFAG